MDLEALQLEMAKNRLADLDQVGRVAALLDSLLTVFKAGEDESVGCSVPQEEARLLIHSICETGLLPTPRNFPQRRETAVGPRMVMGLIDAVIRRMKEQRGSEPLKAALTIIFDFIWDTGAYENRYPHVYDPVLTVEFLQHTRDGLVHLLTKT